MGFKNIFLLLGIMGISSMTYGQKIKYKDLFLLLNSKQYTEAEPFLRKYLKDNNDNPNALLFMGIIFHEKSNRDDVLKETEVLKLHIDSAVIFYDKAYKTITEKEIKRNDEYYESYKRRDLRTGDFNIKLSDVQFDLEKRMQGLRERKTRVAAMKEYLSSAESLYGKAIEEFKLLRTNFPGERELVLRSDESTVKSLDRVAEAFDSSMTAFKNYKATSQLLGKTGYNQVLNLTEIRDFRKDGSKPADFMQEDLALWDFKTWSQRLLQIIEKEISPLRESLIAYEMEINKVREKLKKDSVNIRSDLTLLAQKSPNAALKKIDSDALPSAVFAMKIAELEYAAELIANRPFRDSMNVKLRLLHVNSELDRISKLDTLSAQLLSRDIDKESENYKNFVTGAYGTVVVLKSLAKATNEYAKREKLKKEKEWEVRSQSLKWIVNVTDSIPLFTDESASRYKFRPLVMMPEDHTLGLQYADTVAMGYFFTITPSRIPDVKASFPVDKVNFTRRNLPILKGLSTKDDKGQVYFAVIYSEAKVKEKFSVVIAKIYRSDGLAWSHTYLFDMVPTALTFDQGSGELAVKTTSPTGDTKMVAVDKNGKIIK